MRATKNAFETTIAVIVILACAALLRLLTLGDRSLWIDEFWTMWFQSKSIVFLWTEAPKIETHPPLYYTLLRIILPTEPSAFLLRLPSAIAGILLVPVAFAIGRVSLEDRSTAIAVGLLSAAFCAMHSLLIEMQQLARMYAFLILLYAILIYFVLKLHREIFVHDNAGRSTFDLVKNNWLLAVLIGVTATVSQLIQTVTPIYVVGACSILGARGFWEIMSPVGSDRRRMGQATLWLLAIAATTNLITDLPYLPIELSHLGKLSSNFWIPEPTLFSISSLLVKCLGVPRFDQTSFTPVLLYSIGALFVFAMIASAVGMKLTSSAVASALYCNGLVSRTSENDRWTLLILVGAVVIPLLLLVLLGISGRPLLIPRTISPIAVPLCVLLAVAVTAFRNKRLRSALAVLALVWFGIGGVHYNTDQTPDEDIRGLVRNLRQANANAGATAIIVHPELEKFIFSYLTRRNGWDVEVYSALGPFPVLDPATDSVHYLGEEYKASSQSSEFVRNVASDNDCLWLIVRHENETDEDRLLRAAILESHRVFRYTTNGIPEPYTIYYAAKPDAACAAPSIGSGEDKRFTPESQLFSEGRQQFR
jgi:mannosyltransferase